MLDADSQPSGASIPGKLPDAFLPIPGAYVDSDDPRRSKPEYLQPPRLGIIHLLAWTTVAAVFFKISMALRPDKPVEMNYDLWIWMFKVILNSAAITGAGIVLVTKYHEANGRFQPGHLLLFFSSLATLANLVLSRFVDLLEISVDGNFLVLFPLIVIVLFWFATKITEQGRWKNMFSFLGWMYLISGIVLFFTLANIRSPYLRSLFQFFPFLQIHLLLLFPIAILVITAILDLIHGPKRDWLHWLGVCEILSCAICALIPLLLYGFLK
ncbi:MAG: hypothetical protein ABSA26_00365 [Thermoguttaceae bacterium]